MSIGVYAGGCRRYFGAVTDASAIADCPPVTSQDLGTNNKYWENRRVIKARSPRIFMSVTAIASCPVEINEYCNG